MLLPSLELDMERNCLSYTGRQTVYRLHVSVNKCTHSKIKDTLKKDSLTIYKISKFFNHKMQGHTHTHLHVNTCTHRNTQVHVDMSTVHFLVTDTTQLTLLMKLNSQTIYNLTKMTWKTFEETRMKQVYQSLTCEG